MNVPPFSLSQQISELGHDLDEVVLRVIRSGQYIGGEEVQKFEELFASAVGVPYAIGCNSGTDALILALRALEVGEGDEVITTSFSFFATAEAISAVGAKPVFVDIEPRNFLIDLELIEKAITPATKAVLPVHLFGCPVDMEQLMSLAKKNGLKVIEDCAQASGAEWKGRPVGSWGDAGCFSFFPTKNLGGAGDGGAVTTKDQRIAQKIRELAAHGMPRRYLHTDLGYNSRLDALQAAILKLKLPRLPQWVKQRRDIADRYKKFLKDIPGVVLPSSTDSEERGHAWNQFVVRVENSLGSFSGVNSQPKSSVALKNDFLDEGLRDLLKQSLQEQGINTIIYYPIPIHLQPIYKRLGYEKCQLPVTERICSEVLSLPIFPELSLVQQQAVVIALKKSLAALIEEKVDFIA